MDVSRLVVLAVLFLLIAAYVGIIVHAERKMPKRMRGKNGNDTAVDHANAADRILD